MELHRGDVHVLRVDFELGEVDDRAVDHDVGVRAVGEEEVGEPRHADPEVGGGLTIPRCIEGQATASDDRHGEEEVLGVEAGGPDDDVHVVVGAVVGHHAARCDRGDAVVDEVDVVAQQCCRDGPVIRNDPSSERRVVRRHGLEEIGSAGEVGLEYCGQDLSEPLVHERDRRAAAVEGVIHPSQRQEPLAVLPHEPQPQPAHGVRNGVEEEPQALGHGLAIGEGGGQPRR